eukprot:s2513_g3.t2
MGNAANYPDAASAASECAGCRVAHSAEIVVNPSECAAELVHLEELQHLQGGWYRKSDGLKLGDLIEDFFLWDARMKIKASTSPVSVSEGRLKLALEGQIHEAILTLYAQPTLTWSDGDVWAQVGAACECSSTATKHCTEGTGGSRPAEGMQQATISKENEPEVNGGFRYRDVTENMEVVVDRLVRHCEQMLPQLQDELLTRAYRFTEQSDEFRVSTAFTDRWVCHRATGLCPDDEFPEKDEDEADEDDEL